MPTLMGLSLSYKVVDKQVVTPEMEGEKFIVTCVSPQKVTASFVADLAQILADYKINIERIDKVESEGILFNGDFNFDSKNSRQQGTQAN